MLASAPAEAYVAAKRILQFCTFAHSTLHNPRNLEGHWGPPYTQTAADVFNFVIPQGCLCAAERFDLSLSRERLEELGILERDTDDNDHGGSLYKSRSCSFAHVYTNRPAN